MKRLISIAMIFLLVLSVVPAMTAEQANSNKELVTSQVVDSQVVDSQAVDQGPVTFQAFSKLSATERKALTPLTEKELAAIEGSFVGACGVCIQIAVFVQGNIAAFSAVGSQSNVAGIAQSM